MSKPIDLLTAALALTLGAGAAHAYNEPPPCPETPNLAQCQDPAFMFGACGAPFLDAARTDPAATCNILLRDAALAEAQGLVEREVLVPAVVDASGTTRAAGDTDDARITAGLDEAVGTVGGQSLARAASAAALPGDLGLMRIMRRPGQDPIPDFPEPDPEPDPQPQPPPPAPDPNPAPPATGHDAPVADCAAYARDKYDSYTRFDDAAAALGGDHRGMFDLAHGSVNDPRSIGSRAMALYPMQGTDGRIFTVGFGGSHPKNRYFTTPLAPADDHSIDARIDPGDGTLLRLKGVVLDDPALAATLADDSDDHTVSFWWHAQMQALLGGLLDERLDDLERAQADFAELLARRQIAVDEGILALNQAWRSETRRAIEDCYDGIGGFGVMRRMRDDDGPDGPTFPGDHCLEDIDVEPEMGPYRAQVAARLAAFDAAIEARLEDAAAEGCLDVGSPTACDWSPRFFVQSLRDGIGATRQRAYEKCVTYTKDDFAALEDYTFRHPTTGAVMHARKDYTTSPAALDLFMSRRDAWRRALSAELDEVLDPEGAPDGGPRMSGGASDAADMGNSMFGAGYSYDMRWQLFDIEHGLCNLSAEVDGSFDAEVSVLGQTRQLVMFDAHAGFDRIAVDLEVFDQSLIDVEQNIIDQETYTLVDGERERSQDIVDATYRFTILGIPMSLELGAAGKVGATYGLEATIDRGGDDCDEVAARLGGRLTPSVQVDGYVEVAVDFVLLEAGVKGDLALAHVRLPFEATVGVEADNGMVGNLALTLGGKLDAALRALDGELALYAEIGFGPLSESAQKTLFDWSGVEVDLNVLDFDARFPLATAATWFGNPF